MDTVQASAAPGLATALTVVSLVLGVAFVVVGVVVGRRSLSTAVRRRRLRTVGQRVRGVVVDTQIHSRGRGDTSATSFRPVVSFVTADGREVTTVAGPMTTASWFERTPVDVLHDPDDPERAEVLQPVPGVRVEGQGVLAAVVGGLLALVGLGVVVVAVLGLLG